MAGIDLIHGVRADRPALLDDAGGDWVTYGQLADLARRWATRMSGPRGLVFLHPTNDVASVAALIGAFSAGHAVALFDPSLPPATRADLQELYHPRWTVEPRFDSVRVCGDRMDLNPDLAVLMSTSGSTGSAKLVRLAATSILANASAIGDVLDIGDTDVAVGHLPLHYSYGLSVLTSHLVRGARVRLTAMGLTDKRFWPAVREADVTHMPGVPFHHQLMIRLGLDRLRLDHLRTLTQAGGRLEPELRRRAHQFMHDTGGRFYVMYGQTEASPRMTTLQHADFPAAPDSVGTALPGCRIEIRDPDSTGHGEVVFSGPNVMLGYAHSAADLARADDLGGRLHTGDVGMLDDAGRLTLSGRVSRVRKLFGVRVNVDEVEAAVTSFGPGAVTLTGDRLTIHAVRTGRQADDEQFGRAVLAGLERQFAIPANRYALRFIDELPRTRRGKIDYQALEALS
ncbi:AMP-binding protein [Mycobacterium sp. shizuoka-1]|uniref:AMP-binding protein n=1 Tax=Mycobacterium sp. shizuoka-1 TaxID=2039281 RepID=UPI000C06250B|nr:AMP-binding protein [Mycobacterium sp. shizuoka-1]GAY17472.1 AMP-dependent acyl-CoA synthetase [Mycobacterium sp. shizuoka-1]